MKAKNSAGTLNNSNGTRSVTAISCARMAEENAVPKVFEFSVYPNPANDFITLNFEGAASQTFNVTLMDMNGKVVHSEMIASELQTKTIDISTFASGIYFLKADIDGKEHFRKIIKK